MMRNKGFQVTPVMQGILGLMPESKLTYVNEDAVLGFRSILLEKQKENEQREQRGPFTWDFFPYPAQDFEKEDILRYFFFNVSNDHGYFYIKKNARTEHFYGQFHGLENPLRGSDALYFLSLRILERGMIHLTPVS